jgi:hypothetical protein
MMRDGSVPEAPPRQQLLLAVDFGHAVQLEHVCAADDEKNIDRSQVR